MEKDEQEIIEAKAKSDAILASIADADTKAKVETTLTAFRTVVSSIMVVVQSTGG